MIIPTKQLKSGFAMPVYGLGTWRMGGDMTRNPANDDAADVKAIKMAIEHGVTHIDTAERYAEGHAEELVGEAIRGQERQNLFLVSKVGSTHLAYDDLLQSCQASLKRLGTDYLELYLIHSANEDIPLTETMRAMDKLVEDGLIRHIGVSNFTAERMIRAQEVCRHKIVATQVHYNLMVREVERKHLLEYCQSNDIMLIAWRPVQKGMLSETKDMFLLDICRRYAKTPAQVAINWLISQPNVVTLAKTGSAQHLNENLGCLGWQLSTDDIERLRWDYVPQLDESDAVTLK